MGTPKGLRTSDTPVGYRTAVLYDSRICLFGGYDGKTVFEELYILELGACAYLPQVSDFDIDVS